MLNSNLCGFRVWFSHYHHLDQDSTTSTPIPPYNFHSIFQDREIKVLQLAYLMKDVAFRKYFHDFLNNLKLLFSSSSSSSSSSFLKVWPLENISNIMAKHLTFL